MSASEKAAKILAELEKNDGRPTKFQGDGDCMSYSKHEPHAWTWPPDHGPQVWIVYWCHGVKEISVVRY